MVGARWLWRDRGNDRSGASAVLSAHPLEWVLTDLLMPTGDGLDILAYARAHQPLWKIIVMTAFGSEATRQRAVAQGGHAFVSKPCSGETLLAILTQQLPPDPIDRQ